MTETPRLIRPPLRRYSGPIPSPDRWETYTPRRGDILVCTPSKSGTTWTQSILAMLLNGGPDLPMPLTRMSPWLDADLGLSAEEVARDLESQPGRRVIKTHTPLDGVPIWDGVRIITVYRHPLDVFFSLRKHYHNMRMDPSGQMFAPVPEGLAAFLRDPLDREDHSSRNLASVVWHYCETLRSREDLSPAMLHYADMLADHRGTVARLAGIAQIDASPALIDVVTEATAFGAMKARAAAFSPGAGTGLFHSDTDFFDGGVAQRWTGQVPPETHASYRDRLRELVPDTGAREWLETGDTLKGEATTR